MQPSIPRSASSSTRPGASPLPRSQHQPGVNTQTKILDTTAGRILCIADVRGRLSTLNDLAREANAKAVIHTGDFGFFEASSLQRINDRTLRHLMMYSPLIPNAQRSSLLSPETSTADIRSAVTISLLSEFPLLLSGQVKLEIPVYTVWGACEDVTVLEKFRQGTYNIENLHIVDEATTHCLDVGGIRLRLLGLGGAFVPHKLFDNGDGNATIAGGQGTMWTTALQIGELVDTAQRVFDPAETRLLVTHSSPGREGIMAQLSLVVKADLTISAGLHFRYTSSWNEFSVQGDFDGFRSKVTSGKEAFDKIWDSVKPQVEAVIDENQRILLEKALSVIERVPQANSGLAGPATGEDPAWKNCWNWNLCDAAYGWLVLDIREGRVSAELKSQGFNYAYRRTAGAAATPDSATATIPMNAPSVSIGRSPPPNVINSLSQKANGVPGDAIPPSIASQSTSGPSQEPVKNLTPSPPVNGSDSIPLGSFERQERHKKEKRKDKKDKFDKDSRASDDVNTTDKTQSVSLPDSGKVSPMKAHHSDATEKHNISDLEVVPLSPVAGTDSTGTRTPTSKKQPRNPWTIFMRFSAQVSEKDLREFYGEASSGILRVHLPPSYGKPVRTAFVEFGDEEAMKTGLTKHAEKLKDTVPFLAQAEDREHRDHPVGQTFRGRGGRGRGAAFAARGFAAAGLTRQLDKKPNGESVSKDDVLK